MKRRVLVEQVSNVVGAEFSSLLSWHEYNLPFFQSLWYVPSHRTHLPAHSRLFKEVRVVARL